MQSVAKTVDQYFESLPEDRKTAMNELRKQFKKNLPKGFVETMTYGMPGFVIPHSRYPAGYHCDPELPLGFVSFASQKNFIAVYHMGIYGDPKLLKWFTTEYAKHSKTKLDMGKACIRFKKPDQIPFKLIGELAAKVTPDEYIENYEKALNSPRAKK
ncbi:MAG: DUF1801 domain-containing protein [Bacteroidetes bacterium]|nr:DUF1801 domain-containing protein [Bacteroidota bacterium]